MKRDWYRFAVSLSGMRSKRYILVLLVALVVFGLSAWQALQNDINGDITALLPEDAPSARSLDDITRRFGATNTLILLFVAPPDVSLTEDLEKTATALEESEMVRRVDYRWAVSEMETHGLYYLDVEDLEKIRDSIKERIRIETLKNNPFYVSLGDEEEDSTAEDLDIADMGEMIEEYGEGLVLEGDHVYFREDVDCSGGEEPRCEAVVWGLIVTPTRGAADVNYAQALLDDVDDRLASLDLHDDVRIYKSGRYNYMASEADSVLTDLRWISLLGAGLVCLVVLLFFPSPFVLLLVFIPLLMGIAVDFGIVKLTIGELNLVTTGNFAILFGMGVAYAIHIYSRFREEATRGHPYEDAMESAVGDTGRAALLSALTTALAFFSLVFARYKGFSQLGFITSLGVVFSFLTALIIMPAMGKVLSDTRLMGKYKIRGTTIQDVLKRRGLPPRAYVFILVTGGILTVASIWFAATVGDAEKVYEYDYDKLQFRNIEREQAERYEKALFGWKGEPAVIAANDREDLETLVEQVEAIAASDEGGIIEKVDSILSFIPEDQEAKQEVILEIGEIVNQKKMDLAEGETLDDVEKLRRLTAAEPLTVDTVPEDIRSRFVSDDGGYLVFVYPSQDLDDIRHAIEIRDLLSAESLDRELGATNAGIIFADMQELMLSDAPWVIGGTLLVVLLIVLLDFRSFRTTLLALVPLFLGLLWMVGIMVAVGIRLNWINIIAFPAVIGIGVDNGVHVLHRYRMEGPSSLRRIIRNLGRTLTASTLTTVMGFGALLISRHPGLQTLGLLTIIGLVTTFCASIFFLPAVIHVYDRIMTRIRLGQKKACTLWTVAFDPSTREVEKLLESRNIEFRKVVIDEVSPGVSLEVMQMLRKRIDGPVHLPVLEWKGEFASAARADVTEVVRLLDD